MTDTELTKQLVTTCKKQLGWYQQLYDMAQSILNRIVLSRANVLDMGEAFEQKRLLLETISAERLATKHLVEEWQQRKSSIAQSDMVTELKTILADMESVIGKFLDSEEQLKRHLQHAVGKKETPREGTGSGPQASNA
jgi:hypothetical protein